MLASWRGNVACMGFLTWTNITEVNEDCTNTFFQTTAHISRPVGTILAKFVLTESRTSCMSIKASKIFIKNSSNDWQQNHQIFRVVSRRLLIYQLLLDTISVRMSHFAERMTFGLFLSYIVLDFRNLVVQLTSLVIFGLLYIPKDRLRSHDGLQLKKECNMNSWNHAENHSKAFYLSQLPESTRVTFSTVLIVVWEIVKGQV